MQSSTSPAAAESRVIESLAEHFARLTDQRDRRGLRYPLAPLLVMLVLAKLCEADKPHSIARWVEYRAEWLKQTLRLRWKRMPHPATWRRVLARALDLPEMEAVSSRFLCSLNQEPEKVLNLDGKSLRGTIPKGETHGLKLLALQQARENLVVEQTALRRHENEISAAKRLLKQANLQGTIVTGDAIFAQRELSRQVVNQGGDYFWKVKENQEKLLTKLADFFGSSLAQVSDLTSATSLDKGHGRIEERTLACSSRLADQIAWPYLSQVFCVRREAIECRTQKRSSQTSYGITSLMPMEADATRLLELTRGHWSVENGLHYRRDVTFKEDSCRMKSHKAAEALSVCNNLALGLIRHAGWQNVAEARRFYAAYPQQALLLIVRPPD
jgi:predicted transposase YbfD/YdcC